MKCSASTTSGSIVEVTAEVGGVGGLEADLGLFIHPPDLEVDHCSHSGPSVGVVWQEEDIHEADLDAVRHVYALRPLTQAVVTALNADLTLKDLAEDLAASRYPAIAD